MKLFNLIRAGLILILAPAVRIYIGFLSLKNRIRTAGKPNSLRFEHTYNGQNIVVMALYQKGSLRPDIVRFLEHAKAQGLYVIAVNTLKLSNPDEISSLVDCYYEKPNFGRDFSSYKVGFQHVFRKKMQDRCERLMMVNDSIFFTSERSPDFIRDMMKTEYEVLGSTENFDIEYHLGSFCIAMNQSILQNKTFIDYWNSYRLSDVRPTVIKRGELELSKTLKQTMQNPAKLTALYSAHRFFETVESSVEVFDFVLKNARASDVFAWKRVDAIKIAELYRKNYLQSAFEFDDNDVSIDLNENFNTDKWQLRSLTDIEVYLTEAHLKDGQTLDRDALFQIALKEVIESFMSGSQIHQNAAVLLNLGLPIVKLDGLYRGIFDMADVYRVTEQLPLEEGRELRAMLMSRPYGRRYYVGWRQVAFERGYI